MPTKKQLEEAIESHLALLEIASRRAREQEALAAARLAEVQELQDEVVELQVGLGDALDKVERFHQMLVEDSERELSRLRMEREETPWEKFQQAVERFRDAVRRPWR